MATNPRNSYISGMTLSSSADRLTLSIGPGVCYLPTPNGTGRMATDNATTVTLQQPSANTWQHVYAYLSDDVGTVGLEASTTPPSVTYQGTARTKNGDATRRYLGSVYVGSDSKIVPFVHTAPGAQGNEITYTAPYGVNGTPAITLLALVTTPTTYDCSTFVPVNVRRMLVQLDNTATSRVYIGNSEMGATLSASAYLVTVNAGNTDYMDILLDSNRAFQYAYAGSLLNITGGLNVRPRGFRFDR